MDRRNCRDFDFPAWLEFGPYSTTDDQRIPKIRLG
jgi:hypothetical protein